MRDCVSDALPHSLTLSLSKGEGFARPYAGNLAASASSGRCSPFVTKDTM
jgi:hypothetical protein